MLLSSRYAENVTAEQKYDREFGQKLAAARTAQNVSQRALSAELAKLDVSLDSAALSRLEQGKRAPKLQEAEAIAVVLQIPLQDLLPEAERSPADELGRAWGAVQRQLDDALYKITGLAGHLDQFATLLELHPEAAETLWGAGEFDWASVVRAAARSSTSFADARVVTATPERAIQIESVLRDVASAVVKPAPVVAAFDPAVDLRNFGSGNDGERQTEA